MAQLFFCPVCGRIACDKIGIVCNDCRIQAKSRSGLNRPREVATCFYCQRKTVVEFDHVVPLARGGSDEDWNIVRSCVPCNLNKSDKLPSEWCPNNEAALSIERRIASPFPRMRRGRVVGDSLANYERIHAACENFAKALLAEINALPRSDLVSSRGIVLWRHVQKLLIFVGDRLAEDAPP
jgi:HNH endonuclease